MENLESMIEQHQRAQQRQAHARTQAGFFVEAMNAMISHGISIFLEINGTSVQITKLDYDGASDSFSYTDLSNSESGSLSIYDQHAFCIEYPGLPE